MGVIKYSETQFNVISPRKNIPSIIDASTREKWTEQTLCTISVEYHRLDLPLRKDLGNLESFKNT